MFELVWNTKHAESILSLQKINESSDPIIFGHKQKPTNQIKKTQNEPKPSQKLQNRPQKTSNQILHINTFYFL